MARNAIEIVVVARDEATKQVAVIFDQFGRSARELQAAAAPTAQAFDSVDQAATRQNVTLVKSAQAVRALALPITSELAPALGEAGSVIIGVVARMSTMAAGLGLLGVAAAGAAAVIGGQLVKAFQDAAKEREAFDKALQSGDPGQQAARISDLTEKIRALAVEREKLAAAGEDEGGILAGGEFQAVQRTNPRDAEANLKRIAELTEQIARLQQQREILTRDTSAAEADAESQGIAFLERRRANLAALNDLTRARATLAGQVESAEAAAEARQAGRETERAAAAKAADAEVIAGRQVLAATLAQIEQERAEGEGRAVQGATDAARVAFAERIRLSEEETAIRLAGIERQTQAAIRGAQAELAAVQANITSLKAEPFFSADNAAGAGLRGQVATHEAQARGLQQRLTDATRQGADERAKAEEAGLSRIRQLRQQDAQQALQDLQRALAAEKAARDQARSDAQGLLGRAASSLQGRGFATATGEQLQAEAQRLAQGDTALLAALQGGRTAVDLSALPAALSSQDTLARLGGTLPNLARGAVAAGADPFAVIGGNAAIEHELFLASGGRFGRESQSVAAQTRADQAVDAASRGAADGSRGLGDRVIEQLDEDGLTQRFIVIGERVGTAFSKAMAEAVATPEIADKIGSALAESLSFLSGRNP